MPPPMPTIVAKGLLAHKLDRRYSTPETRYASLQALTATLTAIGPPPQTGVDAGRETGTGTIDADDADHLDNHFFGSKFVPTTAHPSQTEADANNMWSVITPTNPPTMPPTMTVSSMEDADAANGERVITAGLVTALKVSLGLEDNPQFGQPGEPRFIPAPEFLKKGGKLGGPGATQQGEAMLDVASLRRNLPVEVFWVCGKLDGFEVQIAWNPRQVTVFILTPPVKFGAKELNKYPTNQNPTNDRRDRAMRRDARGMLLVRGKTDKSGNFTHTVDLQGMVDGGITPGPG